MDSAPRCAPVPAVRSSRRVVARDAPYSLPEPMLPAAVRMRSSDDFRATVRGARAGRPRVVVHARRTPETVEPDANDLGIRVGFVVSKSVGGAVVRNRVKRRLRHAAAEQIAATPRHTHVVVRALPSAAQASWPQLAAELGDAWRAAVDRLDTRSAAR